MSTPPARKRLPVKPSVENLKKQAKRRAKLEDIQLAEAQHRLACDYGCRNWAELVQLVEAMNRSAGVPLMSSSGQANQPLQAAARAKDMDAVGRILEAGQFSQDELNSGLAGALWYGDAATLWTKMKAIADVLLKHGADPDGLISTYGPVVFGTGECLQPQSLQYLIDAGADVTFGPIETKYGRQCPLSYWLGAYGRGDNDRKHHGIEILLQHNAYIPPEVTPPALAIHRGDAAELAKLLDRDPGLVRQTFPALPYGNILLRGATLLHCAAEFDEIECIDVLLDRHADINARAETIDGVGGQTPIFHLINTGWASHLATLEHLVKRAGRFIDMSIRATWRTWDTPRAQAVTALEYAEEEGDANQRKSKDVEIAILRSLDVRWAILKACAANDLAGVGAMLDQKPELLTLELWPPTVFQAKSLELTRLLLERGLDPNISSAPRRAIDLAAYLSLGEIAEVLVNHGADVKTRNKLGETPMDLLDAYEPRPIGDPDSNRVRAALLKAGAPYDLHAAVRAGDVQTVERILDSDPSQIRGAEPGGPWAPLFTAARSGRAEVAKLLIARGADVNERNGKGNTPLWFACQSPAKADDRIAVATLLIEAGAQVRAGCEDGSTALHFAAWRGPVEMVQLLIRHGAKEWQEDARHHKPVDYARRGVAADREKIVELLDRPVIRAPHFRTAVKAIHHGDLPALQQLLADVANLIHDAAQEPDCYPPSYFSNPKLLWFVANNPNLIEKMPANIVPITQALIDAGAERQDLDYTLGLVMTSMPARVQGHQRPLMKLLISRGALPTEKSIYATLGHGERDAVTTLLENGVPLTAPMAAGMGRIEELKELIRSAEADELHAALSLAVINREVEAARICLDAGADLNRYLIIHSHSTAAHQAAVNDDVAMLRLLAERGAKLDVRDTMWNGTPLGWAIHTRQPAAENYLRSIGAPA
jgi:peptide-methionine (S)-S-oxide reductase